MKPPGLLAGRPGWLTAAVDQPADQRVGATLLWARATVLALVALLTGSSAHTSAGGLLPGWPVLGLLVVATAAAAVPLLARPASRRRVVALTVGSQALIHAALSLTAGHRLPPASASASGQAAHAHDPPGLLESAVHIAVDLTGAEAPMVLLHLTASAVVGLWLARGERALWSLLAIVLRLVAPPAVPCAALTPVDSLVVARAPRPAERLHLLARVVVRRGPPALLAA